VRVYIIKDEDLERLRLRLHDSFANAAEAQLDAPPAVRDGYVACCQRVVYLLETWIQEVTK